MSELSKVIGEFLCELHPMLKFEGLGDAEKLFLISVILNHMANGLINEGNYLDSDEAYENGKMVLEPNQINLDDPMKLATNLLVIGCSLKNVSVNPNGIDIEPYISDMETISPVLLQFYQFSFREKIEFLIEAIDIISTIKEIKKLDFDFNGLSENLFQYFKDNFK